MHKPVASFARCRLTWKRSDAVLRHDNRQYTRYSTETVQREPVQNLKQRRHSVDRVRCVEIKPVVNSGKLSTSVRVTFCEIQFRQNSIKKFRQTCQAFDHAPFVRARATVSTDQPLRLPRINELLDRFLVWSQRRERTNRFDRCERGLRQSQYLYRASLVFVLERL